MNENFFNRVLISLLLLLLFLPLAGCAKKVTNPAQTQVQTPVVAPPVASDSPTTTTEQDVGTTQEADLSPQRVPRGTEFDTTEVLKDVFFDYDQFDLKPEARRALEENAAWLKNNPQVRVLIEGHCDERGSIEYNEALGEKRAMSTKSYLVSLGVEAGRIFTISYGELKPFASGHNEEAWAQNRRAHFKITSDRVPGAPTN